MKKELKAILESDLLNDDSRKVITEAIEQIKEDAKQEAEVEAAKLLVEEKSKIAKAIPGLIEEAMASEINELKDDIERYTQLEVVLEQKYVDFKKEYAEKMAAALKELAVEVFTKEITELKEDLEEQKQNRYGRRIIEALADELKEYGLAPDVAKIQSELEKVNADKEKIHEELTALKKSNKIKELVGDLKGTNKEVVESILENTDYDKLESRYESAIKTIMAKDKDDDRVTESKKITEESSESNEDYLKFLNKFRF